MATTYQSAYLSAVPHVGHQGLIRGFRLLRGLSVTLWDQRSKRHKINAVHKL